MSVSDSPDYGRNSSGLGRLAPWINATVVVVFLAIFWQCQIAAWTLFREQTAEIRALALSVRDLVEEQRHDRHQHERSRP